MLSPGQGQKGDRVVAASVCLDKGCMRRAPTCFLQTKSKFIVDGVMIDIIKVSKYCHGYFTSFNTLVDFNRNLISLQRHCG